MTLYGHRWVRVLAGIVCSVAVVASADDGSAALLTIAALALMTSALLQAPSLAPAKGRPPGGAGR